MNFQVCEGDYQEFGVQVYNQKAVFTFAGEKEEECALLFYNGKNQLIQRVLAPKEYCRGAVRSVEVRGMEGDGIRYNYEIDGRVQLDPYARHIYGREKWNDTNRIKEEHFVCGGVEKSTFDWNGDTCPEIPKSKMLLYKLHVRGFSMDAGIRGGKRGTIEALCDKIAYLKDLGVTTLELMPVYEFEEVMIREKPETPEYLKWESKEGDLIKPEGETVVGLNYWGYTKGDYFAVKASYCNTKTPAAEFKNLIKELHNQQMECVMELFFAPDMNVNVMMDILRYWVREYHVDGFHLIGEHIPLTAIAQDYYLKRTKFFLEHIPEEISEMRTNFFTYNDEYLYPARKIINHLGGSMNEFCNQQKKQKMAAGFVNYMTNNNGFTMADLFSYQEKHNEANGEGNTDGIDWNYSSNCGIEGKTSRKQILELRNRRICTAFTMLLFGQGVPLILAGDEFENSQLGNNNGYCLDNKQGWLNWKNQAKYQWLYDFVSALSAFRKEHPVLSLEKPMQMSDYGHKGCPDLSYHSENAWVMEPTGDKMALGMMYCGDYAKKEDGKPDDYVYVGYNFGNKISHLALPKLPDKKKWYQVIDTFYPEKAHIFTEKQVEEPHQIAVKPNSVIVLLGK